MLKRVPQNIRMDPYKSGFDDDPRFVFFKRQGQRARFGAIVPHIYLNSGENNTNYYYRRIGDQLEPLGKFTKLDLPSNQHQDGAFKGYLKYTIDFDRGQIISDAGDELYYTDYPPAAGSVPLTINDIPAARNVGGRKRTKKYRKNNKKYRTIKNKKRRFKRKKYSV